MKRTKANKTGQAPYTKYKKAPYKYAFPNCHHRNTVRQSLPNFNGRVCTVCGSIVNNFEDPKVHGEHTS